MNRIFSQAFFLPRRFSKAVRTVDMQPRELEKTDAKHSDETRERRFAEEALWRFRQLAENNEEVFWLTNPEKDKIFYISPAYEKIWGRTCESLYVAPLINWLEAIHPEDRNRVFEAALTKQVAGLYDEIYRIQRPNGSIRWIRECAVPVRDKTGAIYRIAGIAEDITRIKEAEEKVFRLKEELEQRIIERTAALQKSEEKYCHLIENTGMPIFSFNHDGRLIFINQIGAQHFTSTPAALVGKSLQELFPQSQINEFLTRIQKVIDSSVGEQFEDNAPFPAGRRWFWLNLQPLKNEFGKPIGVQVITQDITRRKEVEQELVKAKQIAEQSTRAKERFGAHISHEIRTPMHIVVGRAHLLQKTNLNPEQREYLRDLQAASDNLFGILNNILDFEKVATTSVKPGQTSAVNEPAMQIDGLREVFI